MKKLNSNYWIQQSQSKYLYYAMEDVYIVKVFMNRESAMEWINKRKGL